MKIKSITLFNNQVFGDIFFDFTDHNNNPIDTIIIAGENATGKSVLLNIIYEFSIHAILGKNKDEKRIFEIILSDDEIQLINNSPKTFLPEKLFIKDNYLKVLFDGSKTGSAYQIKVTYYDLNGNEKELPLRLFNTTQNKGIVKAIFSDVEINFTPAEITNVTSKDLDQAHNESYRSNSNIATEITQLLVDIQTLDALEFTEWAKANVGKVIDDTKIDLRMKRFTDAFSYMFPTKRFKRITNENGRKNILFEEFGNEVSIRNLSSGEKQIVFRGGFLLKDKKSSDRATVLIDEPEISMHPLWQMKILDFFKKLFTDESGNQTSQIIVATHSPFIIHNCNRYNDKVVILSKDNTGKIKIESNPEFVNWTKEEIIEKAFNIDFKKDFDKPIVFVEGETDEKYLNKAIEIFNKSEINFTIKWIGRSLGEGKNEFTGDTALNQTKSFFLANERYLSSKVILLYDSDTKKREEKLGNLLIRKMPFDESNMLFKKGIENNLVLPACFQKDDFYKSTIKKNDYGAESTIKDLDKAKLCDWICNTISGDEQAMYLANMNHILDTLKSSFENSV